MRAYKVLIDNKKVGLIRPGEASDFGVDPGHHELRVKIDWTGSQSIAFDATADEVIQFECQPNGTKMPGLFDIFRTFRKNGEPWIELRHTSDTDSPN